MRRWAASGSIKFVARGIDRRRILAEPAGFMVIWRIDSLIGCPGKLVGCWIDTRSIVMRIDI